MTIVTKTANLRVADDDLPRRARVADLGTGENLSDDDEFEVQTASIGLRGQVDTYGTAFSKLAVTMPVKWVTIAVHLYAADNPSIRSAYKEQYGYILYADTSYKLHYWTWLTAHCTVGGHLTRMSLRPGGFVRRSIESDGGTIPTGPSTGSRQQGVFYQIDRIATILMGSQRRYFLVCWPLVRCPEEEVYLAPYEVYRRDCNPFAASIALG